MGNSVFEETEGNLTHMFRQREKAGRTETIT